MPKYTINGTTLSDVADAVRELDGNPDTMTPAQMASRIRAVQPGGADLSVIADDYDTTATYDVGDYCIHEGGLYVCTTAISTAEAWTAGHWEEVTVGDELSDLKSDLYRHVTGYDLNLVNAIYSTSFLGLNYTYKYGCSNLKPVNIGNNGKIKITCDGCYIRAFRYPANGTVGADYTDYTADSIEVSGTKVLSKVYFTIRKDPTDNTALTDEDIAEITDNLEISYTFDGVSYETNVRNNFSDIKNLLSIDQMAEMHFSTMANGYINYTSGSVTSSDNYISTDYIDLRGYKAVFYKKTKSTSASPKSGMAFYDALMNYISGDQAVSGQSSQGYADGYAFLDIPQNAVFARFSVLKNTETYGSFELYGESFLYDRLNDKVDKVAGKGLSSADFTEEEKLDISYFKTAIPEYFVTETADDHLFINGILSSRNTEINETYLYGYSIIRPIDIGKNGRIIISCPGYYIRGFRLPINGYLGFDYTEYTQNSIALSGTDMLSRVAFTIRIDPNDSSALTQEQINSIRSALSIQRTCGDLIKGNIRKSNYKKVIVGSPSIYLSSNVTNIDVLGSTTSDIYDIYDALCISYPNWIRRQQDIGVDSDGNGIRHYIVRMFDPIVGYQNAYTNETANKVNYWESTFSYRRIFLNSGVHGNERSSVWALALFVQELLTSSEKWAAFIKGNYCLDIIPILCPWGYDNNSRENANGVNVNRDYNNPDEAKQPETLAITSYIQSIKNEIFCAIDVHTTGGKMCYVATPFSNADICINLEIANRVFGVCVDSWESVMETLEIDAMYPYAYGCMSKNDGTLSDYMCVNQITSYAVTVEGTKQNDNSKATAVVKIIKDMIGNMIMGYATL